MISRLSESFIRTRLGICKRSDSSISAHGVGSVNPSVSLVTTPASSAKPSTRSTSTRLRCCTLRTAAALFAAEADVRDGLVYLDADGDLGGGDEFAALVHAEPDGDQFDLDLTWLCAPLQRTVF